MRIPPAQIQSAEASSSSAWLEGALAQLAPKPDEEYKAALRHGEDEEAERIKEKYNLSPQRVLELKRVLYQDYFDHGIYQEAMRVAPSVSEHGKASQAWYAEKLYYQAINGYAVSMHYKYGTGESRWYGTIEGDFSIREDRYRAACREALHKALSDGHVEAGPYIEEACDWGRSRALHTSEIIYAPEAKSIAEDVVRSISESNLDRAIQVAGAYKLHYQFEVLCDRKAKLPQAEAPKEKLPPEEIIEKPEPDLPKAEAPEEKLPPENIPEGLDEKKVAVPEEEKPEEAPQQEPVKQEVEGIGESPETDKVRREEFINCLLLSTPDFVEAEHLRKEGRWSNQDLATLINIAFERIANGLLTDSMLFNDCDKASVIHKHYSRLEGLCIPKRTSWYEKVFEGACKLECLDAKTENSRFDRYFDKIFDKIFGNRIGDVVHYIN